MFFWKLSRVIWQMFLCSYLDTIARIDTSEPEVHLKNVKEILDVFHSNSLSPSVMPPEEEAVKQQKIDLNLQSEKVLSNRSSQPASSRLALTTSKAGAEEDIARNTSNQSGYKHASPPTTPKVGSRYQDLITPIRNEKQLRWSIIVDARD